MSIKQHNEPKLITKFLLKDKLYLFCKGCYTWTTQLMSKNCWRCHNEDLRVKKFLNGFRPKSIGMNDYIQKITKINIKKNKEDEEVYHKYKPKTEKEKAEEDFERRRKKHAP